MYEHNAAWVEGHTKYAVAEKGVSETCTRWRPRHIRVGTHRGRLKMEMAGWPVLQKQRASCNQTWLRGESPAQGIQEGGEWAG